MKAKKILLCAVSLVLLLLIVVRIVHVNTNVLTIPEERYAQNQWVELNGAFQEMDDENTEGYSVRKKLPAASSMNFWRNTARRKIPRRERMI